MFLDDTIPDHRLAIAFEDTVDIPLPEIELIPSPVCVLQAILEKGISNV